MIVEIKEYGKRAFVVVTLFKCFTSKYNILIKKYAILYFIYLFSPRSKNATLVLLYIYVLYNFLNIYNLKPVCCSTYLYIHSYKKRFSSF